VIGYFTSEYPTISHTFIRREIVALRRRGVEIRTFAIRRPPKSAPLGRVDRLEESRTWYVQPPRLPALLKAHLRALACSPGRYARALAIALHQRAPGPRALLWSLFYFAEGVLLADALREAGVRHLHVHFVRAGGDVARVACLLADIPWSLMLHATVDYEHPVLLTLGDKVGATRFAACASYYVRSQVMRSVPPTLWHRLAIVRCGVEIPELDGTVRRPGPIRAVCVGRLDVLKGHEGLLEAIAQLRDLEGSFRLTLVGDGALRPTLEARARELELTDIVAFAGARAEEEVMEILRDSDLLVLSSLSEGLPLVLMEAMAFGLPVLAPALSGIPELVTDGVDGLLFYASDWEGLSRQLRRLLSDAALRSRLGAAGRTRVVQEFAIDRAVEPLWKRFSAEPDR
jgi:glycosyltransferase involved in cell wall biosynthesis